MRHMQCKCLTCMSDTQLYLDEPYPQPEATFVHYCKRCEKDTEHIRVLTKKTLKEMRAAEAEEQLINRIKGRCSLYGLKTRPLFQSIVIISPRSEWSFDYHHSKITLLHESTYKFNRKTGDPAKAHVQFRDRNMTVEEVVDYIAAHDRCKRLDGDGQ